MFETFKFAHAATDDERANYSCVRATEVPVAVLVTDHGSMSIPTTATTTTTTAIVTPPERVFVLPAVSLPSVPTVTRFTRTYTVPPPLDRLAMKNRRKRRKVIAGVVGGTIGLVVLGPLGAIGIGVGSALVVKHADRAAERKFVDAHQGHAAQGGTA
jgi:hypothetical protein